MMLGFKSNHDIQVLIGGLNALLRIFYATKYVTKMQEQVDSITAVAFSAFKRRQLREAQDYDATNGDRAGIGRRRVASLLYAITNRREIAGPLAALYLLRGSCAYTSVPCATLPLRIVLEELIEQSAHSCDLVELHEHESDVTFRAASFLDDYLFRPSSLSRLSLYEYVAKHFRRKRTQSTAESVFFLAEHPLFSSHCVGTHIDEVVPVVTGMRMPFVDSESPFEIVVKRSQCALVLFKPFRAVEDLVADFTDSAGWVQAFLQWQPTRTSFTREIMANMDDYHRAARQAEECGESSGDADLAVENGTESDDLIGTREGIDAALDHAAASKSAGSVAAGSDAFCHFFDDADADDNSDTEEESAVACAGESSLPIFPNLRSSVSSGGYKDLLSVASQRTVDMVADLRGRRSTFDFSIEELHQFVSDTSNDETEPQSSELFRNERPTEVVELIANALECVREWSPPTQMPTQSPTPLPPFASIEDVARAFTLNERQYVAFTLITTSLLQRFLHTRAERSPWRQRWLQHPRF